MTVVALGGRRSWHGTTLDGGSTVCFLTRGNRRRDFSSLDRRLGAQSTIWKREKRFLQTSFGLCAYYANRDHSSKSPNAKSVNSCSSSLNDFDSKNNGLFVWIYYRSMGSLCEMKVQWQSMKKSIFIYARTTEEYNMWMLCPRTVKRNHPAASCRLWSELSTCIHIPIWLQYCIIF